MRRLRRHVLPERAPPSPPLALLELLPGIVAFRDQPLELLRDGDGELVPGVLQRQQQLAEPFHPPGVRVLASKPAPPPREQILQRGEDEGRRDGHGGVAKVGELTAPRAVVGDASTVSPLVLASDRRAPRGGGRRGLVLRREHLDRSSRHGHLLRLRRGPVCRGNGGRGVRDGLHDGGPGRHRDRLAEHRGSRLHRLTPARLPRGATLGGSLAMRLRAGVGDVRREDAARAEAEELTRGRAREPGRHPGRDARDSEARTSPRRVVCSTRRCDSCVSKNSQRSQSFLSSRTTGKQFHIRDNYVLLAFT